MRHFCVTIPTRICFGQNILETVLHDTEMPHEILLITSGISTTKYGYVERIVKSLPEKKTTVYNKISPNPKDREVDEAIAVGNNCKLVIGLGGGSAIDSAKVAAAGIGMGCSTSDFLSRYIIPNSKTLPIIAIPTTAGTGSELSKGAILTNTANLTKVGIRGEALFPVIAIVDSELTYTVPEKTTFETGFDVFAHAVESYISLNSNEFSRMLSREAIAGIGIYLPRLRYNLNDIEARDKMAYYSMLMGINVGNVGNALPHRLQYPIGAHSDTSHGSGLIALYRAWINLSYAYSECDFDTIFSLLSNHRVKGKAAVLDCFDEFIYKLGVNTSLHSLGLTEEQLGILANEVTGNLKADPASANINIIKEIYQVAFKEEGQCKQ